MILRIIKIGIEEGTTLVMGSFEKIEGYDKGYDAKLTVFANFSNCITILRELIFIPVLSILWYNLEEPVIKMPNDAASGLEGYV